MALKTLEKNQLSFNMGIITSKTTKPRVDLLIDYVLNEFAEEKSQPQDAELVSSYLWIKQYNRNDAYRLRKQLKNKIRYRKCCTWLPIIRFILVLGISQYSIMLGMNLEINDPLKFSLIVYPLLMLLAELFIQINEMHTKDDENKIYAIKRLNETFLRNTDLQLIQACHGIVIKGIEKGTKIYTIQILLPLYYSAFKRNLLTSHPAKLRAYLRSLPGEIEQ